MTESSSRAIPGGGLGKGDQSSKIHTVAPEAICAGAPRDLAARTGVLRGGADAGRPFVVRGGPVELEVHGTAFATDRRPDQGDVVAVSSPVVLRPIGN
jgi:hypothetical protein